MISQNGKHITPVMQNLYVMKCGSIMSGAKVTQFCSHKMAYNHKMVIKLALAGQLQELHGTSLARGP